MSEKGMLTEFKIWISTYKERDEVFERFNQIGLINKTNLSTDVPKIAVPYGLVVTGGYYEIIGRYAYSKCDAVELSPEVFMLCPYVQINEDKTITPEEFSEAANKMGYYTFVSNFQDKTCPHTIVVFRSPALKKDLFYVDFTTRTIKATSYMIYTQLLENLPNHISDAAFIGFKPETLVKAVILFIKARAKYLTGEEVLCVKDRENNETN